MAITIPTLTQLKDQILNDIATEFGVDVSELGTTYIVQAKVQAGMIYQMYLALSGNQKNIFYDLAEETILKRYGAIILGRLPAPAEAGEYTVEVTGLIGATITSGTQFRANDETLAAGSLFVVDTDFTLTGLTDVLSVRSLTPGTKSALIVNDKLTATAPIVNVASEVTVLSVTKSPIAAENISDYRDDIIQQAQIEPQGGSPGDYRLWCSEIPEIRNVYPYASETYPGGITIYVEATADNTAPAEIIGVPTIETRNKVYLIDEVGYEEGIIVINPISGKGRKPIGVFSVDVYGVAPISVDINFTNLSSVSVVAKIRSAIDDLLYEVRPFIAGADLLVNRNDKLTIGMIISVVITVLSGTGITYENLTMTVLGDLTTSYLFKNGEYPYLALITNNGNPV